jgi:hypothetical protein
MTLDRWISLFLASVGTDSMGHRSKEHGETRR